MRRVCLAIAMVVLMAGSATAQMHGPATFEIPLRQQDGRLVLSVATPEGEELDFGISVGSATVITESLAARLGERPELTMGGVPVVTDEGLTIPDEQLEFGDLVLDGMVGPGSLNPFDMLIDVPGGRLVLKEVGRRVEWPGMEMSEPVRMQVYHGLVFRLDAELDGTSFGATLDLGAPVLVVSGPVRDRLGLEEESDGALKLGETTFADVPVQVRDLPIFERWDPDGNGFVLIGAPVTWNCAISVSWAHRELRTCVR